MKEQTEQLIHAFSRSPTEKIQIHARRYKGELYVDLRIWFQTRDNPVFRPTTKGINFRYDYLSELRQGLDRLAAMKDKLLENEPIPSQ